MTRPHSPTCEADGAHDGDCATATELARLRAFAEAVRDEVSCGGYAPVATDDEDVIAQNLADHLTDCWHCAAEQALERAR